MKQKKKGVGKRFIILLIVYVMLVLPFLSPLSDLLPFKFDELWKKLLVAGIAVFLFVGIFIFVEYLNDKRKVD